MTSVKEITINRGDDVILAREYAREMAREIGFNVLQQAQISTATSELSRNAYQFANNGKVTISSVKNNGLRGIEIIVNDLGPGIHNINEAMQDGFSTNNGLGFGLPGARRLMDEFEIQSSVGIGTTVRVKKWLKVEDKNSENGDLEQDLKGILGPNDVRDLSPEIINIL